MNMTRCPACDSDALVVTYSADTVAFKGADVSVMNLASTECQQCGYSFATNEQHDANLAAVRRAHVEQKAGSKAAKGLLTGAQLRSLREALGLTQREAAELFGGGPVAFSKYENEDVAQSVAMDRLVRLVGHMGAFGVQWLRWLVGTPTLAEPAQLQANPPRNNVVIFTMHEAAGGPTLIRVDPQATRSVAVDMKPEPRSRLH